ncbi:MAG TPA: DnaJ domain-containing protein [Bacillota bacterium]|nr:DnaJ domain-containing protein [Bacillota bacterium]HOK69731.1 DnaJ domain-containing protein [Bacillota bacterium]HPP85677.1 DnaJ domain-containing protein [Bacillota bacterium]
MDICELKHKLRQLRRLEQRIRFGVEIQRKGILIFESFFDLGNSNCCDAKYDLKRLSEMSREEYRNVMNEYWTCVYNELFKDKAIRAAGILKFDLPYDADEQTIKKRFRELAKLYHPDAGGDAEQFLDLMDTYKSLMRKKK